MKFPLAFKKGQCNLITYFFHKWCFLSYIPEIYSEPSQTSKMKCFAKIVSGFEPLTIFAKQSIWDVWTVSQHAPAFRETTENFIVLFSEMKFGLLLLFLFLCGFVSFEKIRNEVKDEPTVGDDVDNDVSELDSERHDAVSDEADNGAPDLDSGSDGAVDNDSKN